MTRFVYVLPAGRFRWEVRVEPPADSPKMVRETLCVAQSGIWALKREGVNSAGGSMESHVERLQRLIDECDRHRPIGNDGKHGNRHTPTCGCEDNPVSLFYRLKSRAMDAARAIAIIIGGEVQPHDRRGRIQDPDSYGNDPRESAG